MIGESGSPLCRLGHLALGPSPSSTADMDLRPTPSDTMPRKDNERTMELDKRIEALRRKNEALMKRYREVEEDRKRAEDKGMGLQNRKGKADDLTITISKSTSDTRVVVAKPSTGGSPTATGQQESGSEKMGEDQQTSLGRGCRKQLMVTMAGRKGKRVVCERAEKTPGVPEEGQEPRTQSAERVKQPSHSSKREAPQDEVRHVQRHTEKHQKHPDPCQPEDQRANTDLTIPTSKEEQEEYLHWKREREQIDRERVARHKNAKGQWRREWDVDKTDKMFADKSALDKDRATSSKGARNTGTRRLHTRINASSRGQDMLGKQKRAPNVPVESSKAMGKDRLTGRARRWDSNEDGEPLQMTSEDFLEDVLEELDVSTDPEAEGETEGERKLLPSLNVSDNEGGIRASASAGAEETCVRPGSAGPAAAQGPVSLTHEKAEASPPRGVEKKVHFSSEVVRDARTSRSAGSDSTGPASTHASSPSRIKRGEQALWRPHHSAKGDAGSPQIQGALPVPGGPGTHPAEKAGESASQERYESPTEQRAKRNTSSRTTEELIDSSLCVQRSEATTHTTSTDKARQNGKIV